MSKLFTEKCLFSSDEMNFLIETHAGKSTAVRVRGDD